MRPMDAPSPAKGRVSASQTVSAVGIFSPIRPHGPGDELARPEFPPFSPSAPPAALRAVRRRPAKVPVTQRDGHHRAPAVRQVVGGRSPDTVGEGDQAVGVEQVEEDQTVALTIGSDHLRALGASARPNKKSPSRRAGSAITGGLGELARLAGRGPGFTKRKGEERDGETEAQRPYHVFHGYPAAHAFLETWTSSPCTRAS